MEKNARLIDAGDSLLVVIDVQDKFLVRLEKEDADRVVSRCRWLMQVADWLSVPLCVTAEEIPVMGATTEPLRDCMTGGAVEHDKMVFGLAGQAGILAAVEAAGRRTVVLTGLETDVCVSQSALGLLERGYRVAAVADACASPQQGHDFGLQRMRDAGVIVISAKGLFFEWVRDVERCHDFFRNSGIGVPEDLYIG
ncbi:MAG: isochorismatase family protein [Haliea sp.]|uniref:isochorismatase family protein n=1 Tax=Haliea sp. TaxID=1932666 RepID=UPI0032EB6BB8